MLNAFLLLVTAEIAGTGLALLGHLPLPGPVVGLFLLAVGLAWRPAARDGALDKVARFLLRHMGLLFVPAGVGIIDHLDLLGTEGWPLVAGLVGSTLLALVATALVMEWHGRVALRLKGGADVRSPAV